MKLGFMSSVCPKQNLAELIATAHQHGYLGIEFRTEWKHQHGIELGASAADIARARRLLADAGIAATCLSTSVRFNSADPSAHLPQREALRQYVELAAALGGLKGPIMKAAQLLSTIPEALPPEYARELAQLQSEAPPMGPAFVRRRMTAELGPDWFERRSDTAAHTRRLVHQLEKLGHQVTLEPAA